MEFILTKTFIEVVIGLVFLAWFIAGGFCAYGVLIKETAEGLSKAGRIMRWYGISWLISINAVVILGMALAVGRAIVR